MLIIKGNIKKILHSHNDVPLILALYIVSLTCTFLMFSVLSWVRYIFSAIACVGFISISIIIVIKFVRYFKSRIK